jgi:16S rRNA (guanine527-N7)-methyltransferase
LEALLAHAGVEAALAARLAQYGALLLEANRRVNLTGAESPGELLPHLLDSLSAVPYVREALVDVGSGGGLPAIPLAIATGISVTMIESTRKKAAFLQRAAEELEVDVCVVGERAETAARRPELRDRFESATARAVSSAPAVLELTVPFLAPGGMAVLQRGKMEQRERNALSDAAPMLGAAVEREIALDGERRIILVRKLALTPERFPRRTGVPEKRPLCF